MLYIIYINIHRDLSYIKLYYKGIVEKVAVRMILFKEICGQLFIVMDL